MQGDFNKKNNKVKKIIELNLFNHYKNNQKKYQKSYYKIK